MKERRLSVVALSGLKKAARRCPLLTQSRPEGFRRVTFCVRAKPRKARFNYYSLRCS